MGRRRAGASTSVAGRVSPVPRTSGKHTDTPARSNSARVAASFFRNACFPLRQSHHHGRTCVLLLRWHHQQQGHDDPRFGLQGQTFDRCLPETLLAQRGHFHIGQRVHGTEQLAPCRPQSTAALRGFLAPSDARAAAARSPPRIMACSWSDRLFNSPARAGVRHVSSSTAWRTFRLLAGRLDPEPLTQGGVDALALNQADVVAVARLRWPARYVSSAMHGCQMIACIIPAVNPLESRPHGIALAVPGELVSIDEGARRDRADDQPRQKAVAGRQTQIARRFPAAAAGIVKSSLGIGWQRIDRFGLSAAEIEGNGRRDAPVQRRRHRGRIAASRHRAQQNDPLPVDTRPRQQQVHAALEVPDHPAYETVADQLQLQSGVVAEVIILPADAERLGVRGRLGERMLAALAVTELIRDEHQTARSRPEDAHVLQLTLRLRIVMAVADEDARHRLRRWNGRIQIGRHDRSGPAHIDKVVDLVSLAAQRPRNPHLQVARDSRKGAERFAQRSETEVTILLPVGPRPQGVPGL